MICKGTLYVKSELIFVIGSFIMNGVLTKGVNQFFVISTITKIDVSGLDVRKYDDAYFKNRL